MRRLLFVTTIFSVLFAQTYQSEIQPIWDNNCISSCHISSSLDGGLNLSSSTSYSELVNVTSQGYGAFQRVKPGDPMNSVLHQKIVGNSSFGDRMPKGGSPLAQADEEKIKKWIEEGALQSWSGGTSSSYSYDFGPGPSYIEIDSPMNNQANWSIESWVKFHQTPSAGSWHSLFSINDGTTNYFELSCDGNSTNFNVVINGSQTISNIPASGVFDNQFHHFFVEGDGSKVSFYIDGDKKGEVPYTANFPSASVKMEIGKQLDGSMDEIRVRHIAGFDGVPTQRYVAQTGVELLYQFDDQNTTTITDNSGKGRNGNIVGQAAYEPDVYAGGGGGGGGTPNTIEIVVKLNQNIGNGDVHVGVWYPGSTSAPDLVDNLDNQATPSPAQGWNFQLSGIGIVPSGGPYKVEAFFDQNNNDMPDGGEFLVNLDNIYTDNQGYAYTEIDLGGGGGGGTGSNLSVSLTVDGVADGINGQVFIDVHRNSDETLIQGFQFGETTPITDIHKEFNVQGVSDGETVYLMGLYTDNDNNHVLLAEGQSNTFNWPPSGDIDLVLEKGTYSGSLKATITVNGTDESGSLSFRIFPEGTVITDEMPDLFGAIYGYDDSEVYSSPPSNQEIEIMDLLNDVDFGIYPIVVWYDVGLDTGWDPDEDPFAPGQLTLSSGQDAQVSIGPLNILPGPNIQSANLTGLTPNEGDDLTISVNVTAHSGPLAGEVGSVDLIYYTGSGSFGGIGCNSSTPGTYDCTIPGNNITNAGLVIGIEAFDQYGALASGGRYDVAVQFDSMYVSSVPAERYIMVSVPANLSNTSINGVVGDELGEADPTIWRSFKWINGAYQENAGNLALGSAVWLISKEGASINTSNGYSTALLSGKTINLSNGWNQVGNPYNFPIQLTDDSQVQLSTTVEQKLYQYSGGENYTESTIMQPGSGYWIFSSGSGTIKINPIFGFISSDKQLASKTTVGWKATIEVVAGLQRDKVTAFGLHPEASNGYDRRDFHEPPVIGEYISAYFKHPEAGSLNEDIRLEGEDLYTWPLAIETNQRGIAEISIPDIYGIPNYLEVKLYDPVSRIVYNMRNEASIRITSQGSEYPYYLELLVGSSEQIEDQLDAMGIVPSTFELAQNIPNPFNPVTNIRVSIVEEANVTLKVYNLLGEEINTLALNRSLSKGNHRFIWAGKDDNGNPLPSGVYLYRMEVNSPHGHQLYQSTKKMVLMK